jgi:hypothetical protein
MPETKIKRSQVAHFINTTPSSTATWVRLGTGVTSAKINYNPQTSEEIYINEDSGSTFVESYKPNMPTEMTAIKGNPAFDYLETLRRARPVLSAAETQILNVWFSDTPVSTDQYTAERQNVSIQFDDFGGDGGVATKLNFTINYIGDPTTGLYDVSAGTFA